MKHKVPASWITALLVALLLGVGSYAAHGVPGVDPWDADAARAVRAESAHALAYLATQPRTGDRIADSLYLALAEGEDAWATAFLDRQHRALARAAARLPTEHTQVHNVATLTLQTLEHYESLIAAGQQDHTSFQRLTTDQVGPRLRQHAVDALDHRDR